MPLHSRLLKIANPCHEDWDAMHPVEGGRHCDVCVKEVHDLSSMSETEAREVLAANRGQRMCVRYSHDSAGQIRFAAPRVRGQLARAAGLAAALAACTPHGPAEDDVSYALGSAWDEQESVETVLGEAPMLIDPVTDPATTPGLDATKPGDPGTVGPVPANVPGVPDVPVMGQAPVEPAVPCTKKPAPYNDPEQRIVKGEIGAIELVPTAKGDIAVPTGLEPVPTVPAIPGPVEPEVEIQGDIAVPEQLDPAVEKPIAGDLLGDLDVPDGF